MTRVNIIGWIAKRLKALVGIVEDTDTATHAIAKGKYVIWKGSLRKTAAAIGVGDALSSSNLSEVSEGIGNELNSKINATYVTDDLDNYNTSEKTGLYAIGTPAPAHCPDTWGSLIVIATTNSGASQIIIKEQYIRIRRRTGSPLAWTDWQTISITDTDWIAIKKDGDNSYLRYRRIGNVVTVYAYHNVSSATIAAWSNYTIGQLPSGCRPSISLNVRASTDRASSSGVSLTIGSDGVVYFRGMYTGASDTTDVLQATMTFVVPS